MFEYYINLRWEFKTLSIGSTIIAAYNNFGNKIVGYILCSNFQIKDV